MKVFTRLYAIWLLLRHKSFYVVACGQNEAQSVDTDDAPDMAVMIGAFYKILEHRLDMDIDKVATQRYYELIQEEEQD